MKAFLFLVFVGHLCFAQTEIQITLPIERPSEPLMQIDAVESEQLKLAAKQSNLQNNTSQREDIRYEGFLESHLSLARQRPDYYYDNPARFHALLLEAIFHPEGALDREVNSTLQTLKESLLPLPIEYFSILLKNNPATRIKLHQWLALSWKKTPKSQGLFFALVEKYKLSTSWAMMGLQNLITQDRVHWINGEIDYALFFERNRETLTLLLTIEYFTLFAKEYYQGKGWNSPDTVMPKHFTESDLSFEMSKALREKILTPDNKIAFERFLRLSYDPEKLNEMLEKIYADPAEYGSISHLRNKISQPMEYSYEEAYASKLKKISRSARGAYAIGAASIAIGALVAEMFSPGLGALIAGPAAGIATGGLSLSEIRLAYMRKFVYSNSNEVRGEKSISEFTNDYENNEKVSPANSKGLDQNSFYATSRVGTKLVQILQFQNAWAEKKFSETNQNQMSKPILQLYQRYHHQPAQACSKAYAL